MGGRDQSERLVAINRNSWSRSSRAPNDVIATVLAGFELALEQRRRADWQNLALSAKKFTADYYHAADATLAQN
jgi:hypothetical protein